MDIFLKRVEMLYEARSKLTAQETSLLAKIHPEDRDMAYASAEQNAYDTMVERGRRNIRSSSFAYRKALINTLEFILDCAEDYGYRRAD